MPFSIHCESEICIGTGTGILSLEDAKAGAEEFWRHPEWRGRPIVWDLRSARLGLDPDQVRDLAAYILHRQSMAPAVVAFVMSRDSDFGLARMYEVLREHPATAVQVFRDYDQAVAWVRSMPRGRAPDSAT